MEIQLIVLHFQNPISPLVGSTAICGDKECYAASGTETKNITPDAHDPRGRTIRKLHNLPELRLCTHPAVCVSV